MIQFTLNLDSMQQKPVIQLKYINVLLDTGADYPVWVASRQILIDMFNAELVKRNVPFGVLGGEAKGDVYRIKYFILGELVYNGLEVIVCEEHKNTAYYMILSATMFRNLIYQIDNKNHKLNIDIPEGESHVRNLVVEDSNGRVYVRCNGAQEDKQTLNLDSSNITESMQSL